MKFNFDHTKHIIGMTLEEAEGYLISKKFKLRVMHRDGKDLVGTCDYNPFRFNVAIVNNIVTEVINVG